MAGLARLGRVISQAGPLLSNIQPQSLYKPDLLSGSTRLSTISSLAWQPGVASLSPKIRQPLVDSFTGDKLTHQPTAAWIDTEHQRIPTLLQKVGQDMNSNFNASQKVAHHSAKNPTNHVTITLGPPGTGKTGLLAHTVYLLTLHGRKILICGASNAQLNELCERLHKIQRKFQQQHADLEYIDIVRSFPTAKEAHEMDTLTKLLQKQDPGLIMDFEHGQPDLTSAYCIHLAKTLIVVKHHESPEESCILSTANCEVT